MSRSWRYVLTGSARRDLKRLDPPVQRRVIAALDALVATDLRSGNIRKLSVQEWRLRVGDWRVRFDRDHDAHVVVVLHILPRGRAYRD